MCTKPFKFAIFAAVSLLSMGEIGCFGYRASRSVALAV
jgi:hypothetical protein